MHILDKLFCWCKIKPLMVLHILCLLYSYKLNVNWSIGQIWQYLIFPNIVFAYFTHVIFLNPNCAILGAVATPFYDRKSFYLSISQSQTYNPKPIHSVQFFHWSADVGKKSSPRIKQKWLKRNLVLLNVKNLWSKGQHYKLYMKLKQMWTDVTDWLHFDYSVTRFWLHSCYILASFWLQSDYILTTFCLDSAYILTTFWFKVPK